MNSQTLSDGHLHLWTLADMESAEGTADPSAVRSIRVGAQCCSSLQLGALLDRLERFGPLEKIELADDRVPDERMSDVQREFWSGWSATWKPCQATPGSTSGKHVRASWPGVGGVPTMRSSTPFAENPPGS